MLSKAKCKILLRICMPYIKFNYYLKLLNISQPAISRFINKDNYDEFISLENVNELTDQIYSSCKLFCDIYEESKKIV